MALWGEWALLGGVPAGSTPAQLGTPCEAQGGGAEAPGAPAHLPRGQDTEQDMGSLAEDQKPDVGSVGP